MSNPIIEEGTRTARKGRAILCIKQDQANEFRKTRAHARATSEHLGADGHIVNEDGDLMLLVAERHGLKDVGHC